MKRQKLILRSAILIIKEIFRIIIVKKCLKFSYKSWRMKEKTVKERIN